MGKPIIVAEMSGNHSQSLDRALKIVELAAKAGVDAVKLQTFTPDTMTLDIKTREFFMADAVNPWKGTSLYELYEKAYLPWEWHEKIFRRCHELGLECFSSAYDATSVDFLEKLGVTCYKIASFENTDLPLIKKAAQTGKPLIISTGMATAAELDETVAAAREAGCRDLTLLKCNSRYPAVPSGANLLTIPHLAKLFGCKVGLSDHTLGIGVAVASVALGACLIEKHFIDSRAAGGVDAAFSMEPEEMAQLVRECQAAYEAIGEITYGVSEYETIARRYRRSLYIAADLKSGDKITAGNLRIVRPGLGLPPKYYDIVLGKTVNRDIERGTALSWDMIS